jgi:dUTP pyrophosphatase
MKNVKIGGGLQLMSNERKVKVKKLNELARIPKYQSSGAAGFDFHSTEDLVIMPGETKLVGTGLSFELEEDVELQVRPRSGLSAKTGVRVANAPGTVDSDFSGEVKIILHNTGTTPFTVSVGDRIAQGVICPVFRAEFEQVDELSVTARGSSGFGSTGIK